MTQPPGRTNNPRVLEDWKDKSQGAVLLGRSSLLFLSSRLLGSRCVLSPRARPLGLFLGAGSCLAARPPLEERNAKKGEAGGGGARERSSRRPQAGAGACRKREMPMETPSPVLAWGSVLPGQMPDARCQMVDVRGYLPTALCTLLSLVDCSTRLSPLRPTVTQHCRCVWPWRERRLSGHPHRAVSTASGSASHGQRRVHARRPPAVRSAPYTPAQPQTLGPPACWGASA